MITIKFLCGHSRPLTGAEDRAVCACGETRIDSIDAPAPRFVGHARGPHAEYKALDAKEVSFGSKE